MADRVSALANPEVVALILSAFSQAYTDLPVETAALLEETRLAAAGSQQTIRAPDPAGIREEPFGPRACSA